MLNNRKIRIMTQLAIYENNEGKEDFRLAKYYKSDYARLNVLKTAITITIAYAVLVGMVILYKLQYILDNILILDYKSIGWTILGGYIGVLSFYLIVTLLGFSIRYKVSHKKLSKYYRMLSRLKEIYREEDSYYNGESRDDYEGEDKNR